MRYSASGKAVCSQPPRAVDTFFSPPACPLGQAQHKQHPMPGTCTHHFPAILGMLAYCIAKTPVYRVLCWTILISGLFSTEIESAPLPGTSPLDAEGDLSTKMVAGIDRW